MSDDPFDRISVYRSDTPRSDSNHAKDSLRASFRIEGDWCVARHTPADNPSGWILRWLDDESESFKRGILLGADDEREPAFFEQAAAEAVAADSPPVKEGLIRDVAVRRVDVLWRVLLFSHYDSSRVELYRGNDYEAAFRELLTARACVARARRIYLKAILEGLHRDG